MDAGFGSHLVRESGCNVDEGVDASSPSRSKRTVKVIVDDNVHSERTDWMATDHVTLF
jgi:hypothetical protein